MAKKTTKSAAAAKAVVPPVDPAPVTAAAKTSKPRATAVPRAAKAASAPVVAATTSVEAPAVTDSMIAERAYHKWISGEPGDHYSHWVAAERELRGR